MSHGYTVDSIEKDNLIKKIMEISNEVIAISDFSKFETNSFIPLGPLTMFKKIITNESIPEAYKSFFFGNDIKLYTTMDIYLEN